MAFTQHKVECGWQCRLVGEEVVGLENTGISMQHS